MTDLDDQIATREELAEIAPWIIRICAVPQHHCLHSWAGETADSVRQQLQKYHDDGELLYLLTRASGALATAIGCEYDEELGRGWLHGPHIAAEAATGGGDWVTVAARLFTAITERLPASITTLDAFLNIENARAIRFYRERGFENVGGESYEYQLQRARRLPNPEASCVPLPDPCRPSFVELLDTLFPNTYYSGSRILTMIGDSHHVLVEAEGKTVIGFAVAGVDPGATTGEVQFLGVRQDQRGKGLGRRLLLAATDWLFDTAGVTTACLNVNEELDNARQLYESVGFELRFAGIGLRRPPTH